jgi:hypothetical protein
LIRRAASAALRTLVQDRAVLIRRAASAARLILDRVVLVILAGRLISVPVVPVAPAVLLTQQVLQAPVILVQVVLAALVGLTLLVVLAVPVDLIQRT